MKETGNILIVGASGLLGHEVFLEARSRFGDRVHGVYRTERSALKNLPNLHRVDLLDSNSVRAVFSELEPRYVINCAGIVNKISCDSYEMLLVNTVLPHFLAKLLASWKGRLVHVSTDSVFSGEKGPYAEGDAPDAKDFYGRTKCLGEVANPPHLTVRTSFVGYELETERGLLAWFLKQQGRVNGYRKVVWSGVSSVYCAKVLLDLLARREVTGLLNIAGEPVTKCELLETMAEVFGKPDVEIEPVDTPSHNLSLDSTRLVRLGFRVPPIRELLLQMKESVSCPIKK